MDNQEFTQEILKKEQKKKKTRNIVIGVVVTIVAIGVIANLGGDKESNASPGNTSNVTSIASNTAEATPTTERHGAGTKVTLRDWEFSLVKAKQYSVISGLWDTKPSDGKVFVVLFIDLKNISNSSNLFTSSNFSCSVDDYMANEKLLLVEVEGEKALIFESVEPDKKLKGYVAYEVDENWKEIELKFDSGLFTNKNQFTFYFTPDTIEK